MSMNITETQGMEILNRYENAGNYNAILKDENLFWLTFCKTCLTKDDGQLSASIQDKNITWKGNPKLIGDVKKGVEEFRKFLEKGKEKKEFTVVSIEKGFEVFLVNEFRESSPYYDLQNKDSGVHNTWHSKYVMPHFKALAETFGGDFSMKKDRDVVKGMLFNPNIQDVVLMRIEWKKE